MVQHADIDHTGLTGISGSYKNHVIAASHLAFETAANEFGTPTANAGYVFHVNIPGPMLLREAVFRMQAAASGTYQWGLFDISASATAATKLAGGSGTLNGTGWRSIAASGAPVSIPAGTYVMVVKVPASNQGAMYRASNAGSGLTMAQGSYTWDDTPDLTSTGGWGADNGDGWSVYLGGDLNASAQWPG